MFQRLEGQLQQLPFSSNFEIPDFSVTAPGPAFLVRHLQIHGIINDGNNCCLISLILSLHRIQLAQHLISPSLMILPNGDIDFASLVLVKALRAMPSRQTFSVQSLISIWNNQNRGRFQIQQNDDIWSVAENVLSSLPLRIQPNRSPIFTRFSAFITCSCGRTANEDVPDSQLFRSVPLLQIPEQDQPVSFGSLVNTLLQTPVNTRCRYCNGEANGSLVPEKGKYSVFAINRRRGQRLIKTRLSCQDSQTVGDQLLGELVSVVSHLGGAGGGHWISYHQVDGNWFINNDSNPVVRAPYHPFNSPNMRESVNLCLFLCT